MLYDLSNPLHADNFKRRCNTLFTKQCIVELTEKKPRKTDNQNRYLHTILSYFAAETGYTTDYVKVEYFKRLCNKEIFEVQREDRFVGKITILRSSAELTTEEMSIAIDRFRNWASTEAGIYIPTANEEQLLQLAEIEIERNRNYI